MPAAHRPPEDPSQGPLEDPGDGPGGDSVGRDRAAGPDESRIPHRYRRSIGASALAAGMLGLRDVLESPKDSKPVVEQHQGEPDPDPELDVRLDPDDPAGSVAIVRLPLADA